MSKAALPVPKAQARPASSAAAQQQQAGAATEIAEISEQKFMRKHTIYSAASSWLFAIAGATNIGVLGVTASKMLSAAEQNRPLFKSKDPNIEPVMGNKKYNIMAGTMLVFGGVCMAVSNWLESKKVVTEWQLGAGKLKRKADIAATEPAATTDQPPANAGAPAAQPKNWVASVQPKAVESAERTV